MNTERPRRLDYSDDDIRNALWARGLKATSARIKVMRTLRNEENPLNADLIYGKTKGDFSRSTVYRALEALLKKGIISKIDLSKDHVQYEFALARPHHHHAVCTGCGNIEDVLGCDALRLNAETESRLKSFRSISSHSLEFFGLCRKCDTKQP